MTKIFFLEASFIRQDPSLGAAVLRVASGGSFGDLAEPSDHPTIVTADGYVWWQLSDRGWTAESNFINLYSPDQAKMNKLTACVLFILRWEGGYVNDPRDLGGETKYGISKRSYPSLNIKYLTFKDARDIYERDYWIRSGASEMKWPICLAHLNFAVNAGVSASSSIYLKSDGSLDSLLIRQEEYYRSLRQFEIYGNGWLNRLHNLKDYVQEITLYGLHPSD
jgi:hypothetical protein